MWQWWTSANTRQGPMPSAYSFNSKYLAHLSKGARVKSFDPFREIDWTVPFDLEHFYVPPDLLSLYGTELWNRMPHEQRVRLSMHEAASTLAVGIWFEAILGEFMLGEVRSMDPRNEHFQWMLTEVADECRHSMMFAEMIKHMGTPWYRPPWWARLGSFVMRNAGPTASVLIATLIAEAITDYLNRRIMSDPECHPAMRTLSRIHVIEEARHLAYARHWLTENYPKLSPIVREIVRRDAPIATTVILGSLVSKDVYRNAGLPAAEAIKAARENHQRPRVVLDATAAMVKFFRQIELIDRSNEQAWRRRGLIA